jgi:antitoxin (DNA-binding transcriptional repressor) of toxin-antitoxin stability system
MDIRKAVRCGATVAFRPTPVAGLVGVDSCRPAGGEPGVSSNQVEIEYWPAGSRRNRLDSEQGVTSTTSTRR